MNKIVALLMFVLLIGCADTTPPNTVLVTAVPTPKPVVETRFVVARVSIFEDGLAYGGKRGVYIITDTKTGKEYVGVSGIGISEMSAHTQSMGKTTATVPDER